MSNTYIVVPNTIPNTPEYSLFGFRTLLPGSTVSGATEDSSYPMANAFDYRDNTEASPNATGAQAFVYTQSSFGQADYFGIISKNAAEAELNVKVEIFDADTNAYVEVGNFAVTVNGRPEMIYFGHLKANGYFDTLQQRITLTTTAKVYIMAMFLGRSVLFPYTPSLGFQPGHMSPMDEVENFVTEGNNFTVGRRISKGYQAKGIINFIKMDDYEQDIIDYQEHVLNSRPMFFLWSNNKQNQAIFGRQNARNLVKPTYESSLLTSFNFEIDGYA